MLVLEDFAMAADLPLFAVLASGGGWLHGIGGMVVAVGALMAAFAASSRWGHHVERLVEHPDSEQLMLRVLGITLIVAAMAESLHASAAVGAFLVGLTLMGVNALAFSLMSWLPLVVLCASLHGLFSGALTPTIRGAYAETFRFDYQALAFGLYGAVQRVSQGLGALLSPLASAAAGGGATAAGVAAMGVLALIGVPLFMRWRLGLPPEVEGAASEMRQ